MSDQFFRCPEAYKRRMVSSPALPQQVIRALENSFPVITANQRAARSLHHAFNLRQRALGVAFWEPPVILAWEVWLDSLWSQLLYAGEATELLLNSAQQLTLWREIIAADSTSLRPVDALARTAADAWLLLHAYNGRQRLGAFPGNTDTRTFARWAAEFERRCHRSRYLTEAELPERLRAATADGTLAVPRGLLLVGFDSKTPAQMALLDAVRASGAEVAELDGGAHAPSLTLVDAADEYGELDGCARWLRARLSEQPGARIAVIVPAIDASRAQIDRIFRQTLAPELNDIAAPPHSAPFEFSLGVPLAETSLVGAALDILRWSLGPLALDKISALLLSPWFAADSESELLARAEFDAYSLREQPLLRPQMSLEELLEVASGSRFAQHMPTLLKHLRALRSLFSRKDANARRSYGEWSANIHEWLEAASWAVLGNLDSVEFQARRKWESVLDELASLDFEGARVGFGEALDALERIAADTLFAPESRHAPVQIMGPLESAGSSFDAVWFLRANDLAWPARPAANPLLPWLLQRELAMPGTDPGLDTSRARRITERIAASAPAVVFSYARECADGPLRRSSLAGALHPRECAMAEVAALEAAATAIELESFADEAPIPPPPDQVLEGGAGILQAQAACAFQAFAAKRLFSAAPGSTTLGLDPSERGNLVHRVLEDFWAEVESQAALRQMPVAERRTQLNRSIDVAFGRHHAQPAAGWPQAYLDTERQRLLNLLLPWLEFEASVRRPFTVISREQRLADVRIGPLRLDIRVDRIDRVELPQEAGEDAVAGEIILDYKTGNAAPKDWLSERPNQPQLPLYAVTSGRPNLAGVAFAIIRPGDELALRGYQAADGVLPRPSRLEAASFDAQLEEWRGVLTALAEDFHAGVAEVAPKSYPQTCKHCEQRLFCRLDTAAFDAEDDEDSDGESERSAEADLG
jgi:ATP-dependent helicase/nuclease subunit B